ncbi:MAG: enoyl-CoA hydratase/isomerase family protein [Deferrisomatales bacterium]|nr:enoyl-CoA hydratase/isomerase family protein [Deferrisomatales bacterium]
MVEATVSDGVALLRLNLPKVNAFSPAFCRALDGAVARAQEDAAVGALVVASAVPGVFSAGLDLKTLGGLDRAAMTTFVGEFFRLLCRLRTSPVPVVAAVEGHAIAGGALMLCAADRRVAAQGNYRVGLSEAALGLPLPGGIAEMVRRVLGSVAATEVLCFGALHGPDRALELGFVDRLVAPDRVLAEALDEARRLAALPRAALRQIRSALLGDLAGKLAAMQTEGYGAFVEYWFEAPCREAREQILGRLGGA